jgi:drug/metabolite transporter (DMT)-like permease
MARPTRPRTLWPRPLHRRTAMRTRDLIDLVLLAALWGASFLFMRLAAPEFGPLALVQVRVALAAAILAALLLARGGAGALRTFATPLIFVGVMNSAVPFCLLTYGTLTITGGFAAILNATTPIWSALLGWVWLREHIRPTQSWGLVIGVAGVVVLLWGHVDLRPGSSGWQATLAAGAVLLAAVAYGISATYAKKRLAGVPALVVATGSQVAAAVVMVPLAVFAWPAQTPGFTAWASAVALAVACTALAYLLYFRLIGRVGAVRAASVTFLVPVFATTWGALFLGEPLTAQMVVGGCIILAGTALALGLVKAGRPRPGTLSETSRASASSRTYR